MTFRLQQFFDEGQFCPGESRNITLLTIVSKLILALIMGIAVVVVSLATG